MMRPPRATGKITKVMAQAQQNHEFERNNHRFRVTPVTAALTFISPPSTQSRSEESMKLIVLALLMVLSFAVAAAGQAPAGSVKGKFVVNGKAVEITNVYALVKPDPFEEGKDAVYLYFTSAPVDPASLQDDFALFEPARDGKIAGIEVQLDSNHEPASGHLFHQGFEDGNMSISGINKLEVKSADAKRISGTLTAGPEESFGVNWEYALEFSAPILPKPPQKELALDSEPAKVALAFQKAAHAGDKVALKKIIAPEMAADLDGPNGPALLKMLPEMFPLSLKLAKVTALGDGKRAAIVFKEAKGGGTTTVHAAQVNGEWKISK
jgi:uncharacterized protein YuzE